MENEWGKILLREAEEETRNSGLRKGQWTQEEDSNLSKYSCRLRWLNYLRPDLRKGNFTLEEQLLILQLHFRWGNRFLIKSSYHNTHACKWSKIAQELPGRTDNEVKNYWRTKVQKLAKHFNCDANSLQFREALWHIWIPRLVEQIRACKNSQSNSGPFINCPIHEDTNGPQEQCTKPIISDLGCLFGPSCVHTFMDQPTMSPAEATVSTDSYEAHIYPDSGSSGGCLDYGQTWDQQSDDFLWELEHLNLNNDDSMLYLPFP
ncbi:hypothetical protein Cgig2_020552 [Carnegiea gigantea]|uniref:Uncharacterized protein n=1 Tax=Carnegiea gigantea TaxID=171969 RepID=A0A9Q1Q5U7_9CARY|nr:hypothetical protein Cgig2_020552 [Carnegiea gigantea]